MCLLLLCVSSLLHNPELPLVEQSGDTSDLEGVFGFWDCCPTFAPLLPHILGFLGGFPGGNTVRKSQKTHEETSSRSWRKYTASIGVKVLVWQSTLCPCP